MFKITGIICAAMAIALIFGGYFLLRRQQQSRQAEIASHAAVPERHAEQPKVRVIEDEAFLKNSRAIIQGTIENISNERLSDLSLNIKLINRDGNREELRTVPTTPTALAPGEQATYALTLPSNEWKGAKVVGVVNAHGGSDYAFVSERGKARPREAPPAPTVRTVIVKRPAPKSGEEFLNTPDNPEIIR